MPVKRK